MGHKEDANGNGPGGGLFSSKNAVELYTGRIKHPRLFPQERKAVDRYFFDDRGSVLDVGCGIGRVSHLLDDEGFDVTGIDISEPFVETAREQFPGIDFYVEDIKNTSFDSKSFDYVVFSYFGIDYILPKEERMNALKEIFRLLKPGGILLFSSHNRWHPFVPLSVRNLGFALKDIYDLYLRKKNRGRVGTRYKIENVPLGDIEIYLSDPVNQWVELRKCGLTPIDVIGKRDGILRLFERDPHYVAKK